MECIGSQNLIKNFLIMKPCEQGYPLGPLGLLRGTAGLLCPSSGPNPTPQDAAGRITELKTTSAERGGRTLDNMRSLS
jgi:hypothetical protein